MRVVDLLNLLQRFPGEAPLAVSGNIIVDGPAPVVVVQDGVAVVEAVKGTKGVRSLDPGVRAVGDGSPGSDETA